MRRVLLLGAPAGTGNLGVDALAGGALTVIARRWPQADVAMLDYGREAVDTPWHVEGRVRHVSLVPLRFSWKPWVPGQILVLLAKALFARALGKRFGAGLVRRDPRLSAIADAGAAFAVSGGDSFSDLYGLGRLWYVVLPQLLALALGVPLVLLPQTIGPFRRPFAQRIARFVLRRASRVHGRDEDSVALARSLMGEEAARRLRFCPDLAFVLAPRASEREDVKTATARTTDASAVHPRPLVALNPSGLLAIGGYRGSNEYGLRDDPSVLAGRLVDAFVAAGADVLLVPHVRGGHESDVRAVQALLASHGEKHGTRLRALPDGLAADETKAAIGRCDLLVGARMHACIGALSQGVPAVGLAYGDKFAGVFASAGVRDLVADLRRLDGDEVVAKALLAFEARAVHAAHLRAALPDVRARVLALLDESPRGTPQVAIAATDLDLDLPPSFPEPLPDR